MNFQAELETKFVSKFVQRLPIGCNTLGLPTERFFFPIKKDAWRTIRSLNAFGSRESAF